VFFVFALIVLALLYHVSRNSQWERTPSVHFPKPSKPKPANDNHAHEAQKLPAQKPVQQQPAPPKHAPKPTATITPGSNGEPTIKIPKLKETNEVQGAYRLPTKAPTRAKTKVPPAKPTTKPAAVPGSRPGSGHHHNEDKKLGDGELRYADWPKPTDSDPDATSTVVYWTKPYEFFPIPEESLIMLPTGKPKPIPMVQYDFKPESDVAKGRRESRLLKIKAEAKRAWTGYKRYAWMHDEVKPVTKGTHDPFGGWAATLVDSLDTLWIMGMKEEFDEAVEAVKQIDFTTTSHRPDIPVFETIIRYLGGLIGAYDVTGGHKGEYHILLDKAVELAEVLMSVFDTPNRMPILYYYWKPAYNQNPKRASTNSGVAELGTMSMEFTRLAQLTGKNKYYDAIARITDALEDLQNRPGGTALSGIFPQNLDASGCNRTAAEERKKARASEVARKQAEAAAAKKHAEDDEPQGYTSANGDNLKMDSDGDSKTNLAFEVQPGNHYPGPHRLAKRDYFNPPGQSEDSECVPQGLTRAGYGMDSYSMGGSQDSAYEYFPKQFLLLGGLVDQYRKMHEKTVEGVKKYLLFRPQAEGDPDILFSAKAFSTDGTDQALSYEYEVTHLTCFLGGMFGLGGKIFENEEDVEIGKRLAAGCAWAYEVMPKGIMPEHAQILPCANASDCQFNRKAWEMKVDPYMADRERQMDEYLTKLEKWKVDVEEAKKARARQDAEQRRIAQERKRKQEDEAKKKATEDARKKAEAGDEKRLRPGNGTPPHKDDKPRQKQEVESHPGHDLKEKSTIPGKGLRRRNFDTGSLPPPDPVVKKPAETQVKKVEQMIAKETSKMQTNPGANKLREMDEDAQKPIVEIHIPTEPVKPTTHQEYMSQLRLIPGFASINDRRYILR